MMARKWRLKIPNSEKGSTLFIHSRCSRVLEKMGISTQASLSSSWLMVSVRSRSRSGRSSLFFLSVQEWTGVLAIT